MKPAPPVTRRVPIEFSHEGTENTEFTKTGQHSTLSTLKENTSAGSAPLR
jgi:hypothetical protein